MDGIKGRTTQYLRDGVVQVKTSWAESRLEPTTFRTTSTLEPTKSGYRLGAAVVQVCRLKQIHKFLSTRGARISIRLRLFTKASGFHIT